MKKRWLVTRHVTGLTNHSSELVLVAVKLYLMVAATDLTSDVNVKEHSSVLQMAKTVSVSE